MSQQPPSSSPAAASHAPGVSRMGECAVVVSAFSLLPCFPGAAVTLPSEDKPELTVAGRKWRLVLYPGGCAGTEGWVSLFLKHEGPVCPEGDPEVTAGYAMKMIQIPQGTVIALCSHKPKVFAAGGTRGDRLFVSRAALLRAIADSDSFTITVQTEVEIHQPPTDSPRTSKHQQFDVLAETLNGGAEPDAEFIVGDSHKRFPVHRAVLAARSPALRAALFGLGSGPAGRYDSWGTVAPSDGRMSLYAEEEFEEHGVRQVLVEDVDEKTFSIFLDYIYSGDSCDRPNAPASLWAGLAVLADRFQVPSLLETCEERLSLALAPETAADIVLVADKIEDAEEHRERCITWLKRNSHVLESPEFKRAVGSARLSDLRECVANYNGSMPTARATRTSSECCVLL